MYKLKADCLARRLSVDNMVSLESSSGGSIKGTKLPPDQRVIHVWSKERDQELEAKVGDWIVFFFNRPGVRVAIEVYPDNLFQAIFEVRDEPY